MPPSDPAAVCLCGSPHADWTAYGKLLCARCAANVVVASGSFVAPAAVPPRTSCCQHFSDCAQHNAPAEPVGPCDCGKGGPPCGGEPVPPPVPEWMAKALGYESVADFNECYLENSYYEVPKRELVRLLASVREATLREAADKAMSLGGSAYPSDCHDAILSLLHTPPSGGA